MNRKMILLVATATAPALAQAFDYESLQAIAGRFPPSGWTNVPIFSTTGWQTLDVTSASAVGSANVITPNDSAIDAAQRIENIIAATSGNRILYFPAGTYYLKSHLQINRSNVLLTGAGVQSTQFTIAAPSSANAEVEFAGAGLQAEVDVVGLPQRGASTITLASTSGIAAGDVIHVYEKSLGPASGYYHYGQMADVTAVSGSTVTVSPALGLNFTTDPKVKEVSVIRNVGIRGIHVFRDRAADSATTNNVEFAFVKNGVAREIESSWLERGGVTVFFSLDTVVISSFFHNAYDYGEGGQAYGISLTNNTTRARVTDNKIWEMRHHAIIQRGANHSIISYNSIEPAFRGGYGDLDVHGFTVHNSLFEGNMGNYLDSDARSDVGQEQYSGIYNTFYRNNLTRYPQGGRLYIFDPVETGNFPNYYQTAIGNSAKLFRVEPGAVDPWLGANRINGTVVLGSAPSGWSYPASLYLTDKPTYFGSRPWPIFGPGLTVGGTFGIANNVPAFDRAKP